MSNNESNKILLAFGSEFGNAYDCCRIIFYELYKFFEIDFLSLDKIDTLGLFKYRNIILIVSTTGYGNCPHNMFSFWLSLFNNRKNVTFFNNMYFHIFGLGDSTYENYNSVAKNLKKKLVQFEAQIVTYALGNYQHPSMHYTNFNTWKKKVYQFLKKQKQNESDLIFQVNQEIPHIYKIEESENIECKNHIEKEDKMEKMEKGNTILENIQATLKKKILGIEEMDQKQDKKKKEKNWVYFEKDYHHCQKQNLLKMEMIKNEKLTTDSYFQDVRKIHLKIDTQKEVHINVGSLLKVYPFLNEEKTKQILQLLKINYNEEVIIKSDYVNDENSNWIIPLNQKIKVLDLFVYFIDLNKIVTPFFFFYLSKKTHSEIHKKKFLQFADTTDISEYFTYVIVDKRSYYDIFTDFFNYINIDLQFLINTLPHIQTRCYSILNSTRPHDSFYKYEKYSDFYTICHTVTYPTFFSFKKILDKHVYDHERNVTVQDSSRISENSTTEIELLICLYEVDVNKNKKLKGLCSQYLTELKTGSFLYANIENGLIHLNKNILDLNYRIVYIATGAAFSSLLSVMRRRYDMFQKRSTELCSSLRKSLSKGVAKNLEKGLEKSLMKDVAFLGCRQREQDFYFKDELETRLDYHLVYIAFSRDVEGFCFLNKEKSKHFFENTQTDIQKDTKNYKALNASNVKEQKENLNESAYIYKTVKSTIEPLDSELKQAKEICKKKKTYVTDIVVALENFTYNLLKSDTTIFLIAGKSRPFSQNLIKAFADIIKKKEQEKTIEQINEFLKKKIDNLSIILESWY